MNRLEAPPQNGDGGSAAAQATPRPTPAQLLATLPARGARREFVVGLFAVAAVAATLFALLTFTDASMFRGRYRLTTVVADAGGLRRGDPVRMRGVNVGRVRRFTIGPGGVVVQLDIEREFGIPAGSRVVLRSAGLMEGMVAQIVPGPGPEPVPAGTRLAGSSGVGFAAAAESLGGRADTILAQLQEITAQPNVDAVGATAAQLRQLTAALLATVQREQGDLVAITGSLRRASAELERATAAGALVRPVARSDSLLQRLDTAAAALARSSIALEAILRRTERGEGTLGRFTRDDALYEELLRASRNLGLLAEDVRRNPKRYIQLKLF